MDGCLTARVSAELGLPGPCPSSWHRTGQALTCHHALSSCSQRSSGAKKQQAHEGSRPLSVERPGAVHPWVSAQLRDSVQPSHLFIQDPTMPPNPAPNPLTQLEEARRRLEEEEKRASKLPSKQRYAGSGRAGHTPSRGRSGYRRLLWGEASHGPRAPQRAALAALWPSCLLLATEPPRARQATLLCDQSLGGHVVITLFF